MREDSASSIMVLSTIGVTVAVAHERQQSILQHVAAIAVRSHEYGYTIHTADKDPFWYVIDLLADDVRE